MVDQLYPTLVRPTGWRRLLAHVIYGLYRCAVWPLPGRWICHATGWRQTLAVWASVGAWTWFERLEGRV